MENRKKQLPTWLVLVGAAIFMPFAVAAGVWQYMNATATPLHSDPKSIPSAGGSNAPEKWLAAVERARERVRADLVEQNLPGLSVAVGVDGEIVWAEGFGWAHIDTEVKVEPTTRFRIGTASQALTSAAVGLLLEDGRLKLDGKIQIHVPEFPEKEWPVTLGHLLGHLAGVRNDGGDEGPLFSEHCERPVDAVPFIAEASLRFEPGTAHRQSSYGFILISAAVEAAAAEPFFSFMRQQIFEPLGMADTMVDTATIDTPQEPVEGQATSYFPRFAADPRYGPDPMRPLDYSCYAGASAFLSTPSDLVRFAMAIDRGRILKRATVEQLQTSQRLKSGEDAGYGLGWEIGTVSLRGKPTRTIGHNGKLLGGMAVSFMTFQGAGMTVSVMSNTSYADTHGIAVTVAGAFAGQGK